MLSEATGTPGEHRHLVLAPVRSSRAGLWEEGVQTQSRTALSEQMPPSSGRRTLALKMNSHQRQVLGEAGAPLCLPTRLPRLGRGGAEERP